jgi:hypothetical protein
MKAPLMPKVNGKRINKVIFLKGREREEIAKRIFPQSSAEARQKKREKSVD